MFNALKVNRQQRVGAQQISPSLPISNKTSLFSPFTVHTTILEPVFLCMVFT